MSRTPGGSKIIYTWAESDTNYTNQGRKWNHVNNVKARLLDVNAAQNKSPYWIYPEEFNLTNPSPAPVNPYVKDRAQMHNTSPKCFYASASPESYTITLPVKVTNNQNTPMHQLTPNVHWYASAALEFTVNTTGINTVDKNELRTSLYPNPSMGSSRLRVELDQSSRINVGIYNQLGQMVQEISANGQPGKNEITINTVGLSTGVYIVQVKAGQFAGTRKLILE
jgi:hypothetical protein